MKHEEFLKMLNTINKFNIKPIIFNNLTMIVCRADSPPEKLNILSQVDKLNNNYNIKPIEIMDRKAELIQIYKDLNKKNESLLLKEMAPLNQKSPAL